MPRKAAQKKRQATQKPQVRRRFKPMRVADGFRGFVMDQLADVPEVTDRRMFGGVGLYAGDVFFGLIAADVLYFKVDDSTRGTYDAAGSKAFTPYADRSMTMSSYYAVPVAVLEDAPTVAQWAATSVRVAIVSRKPAKNAR